MPFTSFTTSEGEAISRSTPPLSANTPRPRNHSCLLESVWRKNVPSPGGTLGLCGIDQLSSCSLRSRRPDRNHIAPESSSAIERAPTICLNRSSLATGENSPSPLARQNQVGPPSPVPTQICPFKFR